MKKVLFILDDLGGGGAERVFVNIANGFAANRIKTEFLLGRKRGVYLNILNPAIPVSEVGGNSLLAYLRSFPSFFRKGNYTHIFTATQYTSAAAIAAKKITKVPALIYLTHHYSLAAKKEFRHIKGYLLLKSILFTITPFADKIIAVSKGSLEWLKNFTHHKLPQGTFIHNPVFDDSIYLRADEEVNFPVDITGKTILLNIGRLTPEKDHATLVKAFSIYQKGNPAALLFILGSGPLKATLQAMINEYGLDKTAFLVGFEENPYKWIAKCDVLISASKYEGFGNVIVEAMALGKTVVSTDCPSGPAEILDNGKWGYFCAVEDAQQMAKAIEQALASPVDKEALIKQSQKYTVSEILKKYLEIL